MTLNTDLKLMILKGLDRQDCYSFCQGDSRISQFCRTHQLTAMDDTINENNPFGVLIDTRLKLADYINRGYETVYSLILNTEEDHVEDHWGNDVETNIGGAAKDVEILGIVPGYMNGTYYAYRDGYDHWSKYYHLSLDGLPPAQGSLINIVAIMSDDEDFPLPTIYTYNYKNETDLENYLKAFLGENPRIKENEDDENFTQVTIRSIIEQARETGKWIGYNEQSTYTKVLKFYSFPCP